MHNIAACKHRIKVKFMDEIRIASKKICTHHTDNHEIDILFKNIQNLLNGDYVYIVSYSIIWANKIFKGFAAINWLGSNTQTNRCAAHDKIIKKCRVLFFK